MDAFRARPLRNVLVLGALFIATCALVVASLAGEIVGRRDEAGGVLPTVLRAHSAQVLAEWVRHHDAARTQADEILRALLARAATADLDARPLPWVRGACESAFPAWVTSAGAWSAAQGVPVMMVDHGPRGCSDRWGTVVAGMLSGPPLADAREVERAAQQVRTGMDLAPEGGTALVNVHRDRTRARWRWARRTGDMVAFVDVDPALLPAVTVASADVRADILVTVGTWPVGYVLGGPDERGIPDALAGLQTGETRALDLPELAARSAAQAVLAWQDVAQDAGTQAFGASSHGIGKVGEPVVVHAVSSVAAPLRSRTDTIRIARAAGVLVLAWLAVGVLVLRRMGNVLHSMALQAREAWLGMRDDDEGSASDLVRARRWMDVVSDRVHDLLGVAFGSGERFWAPAPMQRLLTLLRRRLDAPVESPERRDPPAS